LLLPGEVPMKNAVCLSVCVHVTTWKATETFLTKYNIVELYDLV